MSTAIQEWLSWGMLNGGRTELFDVVDIDVYPIASPRLWELAAAKAVLIKTGNTLHDYVIKNQPGPPAKNN